MASKWAQLLHQSRVKGIGDAEELEVLGANARREEMAGPHRGTKRSRHDPADVETKGRVGFVFFFF